MVTIQQARQQLQQQKSMLQQRREAVRTLSLPTLTPTELRERGRGEIAQRQLQQQQISRIRSSELVSVKKTESALKEFESRIEKAQRETDRFQDILDRVARGRPPSPDTTSQELTRARKLLEPFKMVSVARFKFEKAVGTFKEQGLNPIFSGEELVGFKDTLRNTNIGVDDISSIGVERLSALERAGFIETTTIEVPIGTEPREREVKIAPGDIENFRRVVEDRTPELKFLPKGKITEGLKSIIGFTSGGLFFTKERLIGKITGLKDIEGKNIFTPAEARGLGEFGFEVASEFALGKGVGKVTTLTRGAFLSALPESFKASSKFKKVIRAVDISILAGLGTAESIRIGKIAQTDPDRAILELVGLVSFGAGFSKTGLKTDPQAEADFKKIVDKLKKLKFDKKGSALVPKKKKDRFGLITKELNPKEVRDAREIIGALERRLARAKSPKEQLKILAEIKKGLKSQEAIDNFNKFVLTLIEKNILKLPKIEILPGVTVKGLRPTIPPPKPTISPSAFFLRERVKFQQDRNAERIKQAQKPLNQKFKEAQIKIGKIKFVNKQITKQQVKISQLVSQRVSQQILQKEIQKLKTLQRTRQDLANPQAVANAQRLRQLQSLRTKQVEKQRLRSKLALRSLLRPGFAKAKPRLRRLRVPPLILFPKPKVKLKEKLVRVPLAMGGYNAFVKSKGKFRKVNIVPLKKKKAHDLGSWLVDRSTARTWKVKQIGFKAQKPVLKIPANYFDKNIRKFRGRKMKGKVQPIKNLAIEKSKFAIDTKSEKKQLSVARVRAELLRKVGLKKPRKSSTPKLKSTRLIKLR